MYVSETEQSPLTEKNELEQWKKYVDLYIYEIK